MKQENKKDTIKKKWESPDLQVLNTRDTSSGYPPRNDEDQSYDPVIS
jgi:hypothetical protein